jgi:carboxyl-terminal processing protease
MKCRHFVALGSLMLITLLPGFAQPVPDSVELVPKEVYGKEARVISYILDNNHYRRLHLNDSLSSAILDAYVKELDNNKTYFLASDIQSFERYRFAIDDLTRNENVTPAYEIYKVFKTRYAQRMDYVMNHLLGKDFDFTINESYDGDRDQGGWAKSETELNEVWRKIIKGQALSLKIAGKKKEDIDETLRKRYERFVKNIAQFNAEDVWGIYMNCITEAYDPHTNYFSPKATDLFNQSMRLSLEGIGARLQTDNDYTKFFEIIPGGPAEKSNELHVNDLIVAVGQGTDGELVDILGWRVDEVVKLIKGPKGTTVRLQILPASTGVNGPTKTVTLVRDKIKLEDAAAKKDMISYQQDGRNLKLGVSPCRLSTWISKDTRRAIQIIGAQPAM